MTMQAPTTPTAAMQPTRPMRMMAVDDEPAMLEEMRDLLAEVAPDATLATFADPQAALADVLAHGVDVAFLDIEMGGVNGLHLAARIKQACPDARIVFVTGYSQYAVDAFRIHATGYLLKPVDGASLRRELDFIRGEDSRRGAAAVAPVGGTASAAADGDGSGRRIGSGAGRPRPHIRVQTFGGFDVFVDGVPVRFGRAKSKELLALLVDRRGTSVTASQAYSTLFEDAWDTPSRKSYFRVIVADMRADLRRAGAGAMLTDVARMLSVAPERFDCDYYRFLAGDPAAVNEYRGDYLPDYAWAESRNAGMGL